MTAELSESYLGVNYALRPAKQVERRMLIDAFQILGFAGFPIREYQYTGFGSLWFVDFILLHKILGIQRMVSVEGSERIAQRVVYNQPFRCVDTLVEMSYNVIPQLSRDRKHILWLDYDRILEYSHLSDARMAASQLSPGSILLITVDTEPPPKPPEEEAPGDEPAEKKAPEEGPAVTYNYFLEVAAEYWDRTFTVEQFGDGGIPSVATRLLNRAITSGLSATPEVEFLPLFKFLYADGHRMLTIGGMIGGRKERRRLNTSGLGDCVYIRRSLADAPFEITVPPLTRRERLLLDQNMPCPEDWVPEEFKLEKKFLEKYRDIYRFFPGYEELLV